MAETAPHSNVAAQKIFHFSVNPSVIDKPRAKKGIDEGFQTEFGTIENLRDHILAGHMLSHGLLMSSKRVDAAWYAGQIIVADIDHAWQIDQALRDPFVQKYGSLLYTTPSHSEVEHRFRIVFVLPELVKDKLQYKWLIAKLHQEISYCDPATTSVTNLFFGNTKAEIPLINPEACLPASWLQDAAREAPKHVTKSPVATKGDWDGKPDGELLKALSYIPDRKPGRRNHTECVEVVMGLVSQFGKIEAEQICLNAGWSLSGFHPDWDLHEIIESCNNLRCTIWRVFNIAEDYGYQKPKHWCYGSPERKYGLQQISTVSSEDLELQKAREQQRRKEFLERNFAKWKQSRKFTPDIQVDWQYIEAKQLISWISEYTIVALKSQMGTGKTQAMAETLTILPGGALAFGSRNALMLQSCERWSNEKSYFVHLNYDKAGGHVADIESRLACCIDSILKFKNDWYFDRDLLILDEITSTFVHALISSTMDYERKQILEAFEKAVQRAKRIVLLDGNLKDSVCDWITSIRKKTDDNCTVLKVENTFKPKRLNFEFVSAVNEEDALVKTDKSPILNHALSLLRTIQSNAGAKRRAIVIIADSRWLLESYDSIFTKEGYKTLRFDSKTVDDKEVRNKFKNIDAELTKNQIDVLLLSPTAEMGVDIAIREYFEHGYAVFHGLLGTDSQLQFLKRVRDCDDWTVWCSEFFNEKHSKYKTQSKDDFIDVQTHTILQTVREAFQDNAETQDAKEFILKSLEKQFDDLHLRANAAILSDRYFESQNCKFCLMEILKESHDVTEVFELKNPELNATVKIHKDEIQIKDATDIFNAESISINEALNIQKSFDHSKADSDAAKKAMLLERLPGIEDSELWSVDFVRDYFFKSGRDVVVSAERFYQLQNPDVARLNTLQKSIKAIKEKDPVRAAISPYRDFFAPDLRSDLVFLERVRKLGFLDLIGKSEISENSPEIQEMFKKIKHSKINQQELRMRVGKSAIQYINKICKAVGIVVHSRNTGRSQRTYSYSNPLENPEFQIITNCIVGAYQKRLRKFVRDQFNLEIPMMFTSEECREVEDLAVSEALAGDYSFAATKQVVAAMLERKSQAKIEECIQRERAWREEHQQAAKFDVWQWLQINGENWEIIAQPEPGKLKLCLVDSDPAVVKLASIDELKLIAS